MGKKVTATERTLHALYVHEGYVFKRQQRKLHELRGYPEKRAVYVERFERENDMLDRMINGWAEKVGHEVTEEEDD